MAGVSGGNRMDGVLRKLVARLDTQDTLKVGFLAGSTEADGTSIPMIAAVQEWGGTIKMPARQQTIYRSIRPDGEFNKSGRFVKRVKANYATTHAVAGHAIKIPARPFFRPMIQKNSPQWAAQLAKIVKANDGVSASDALSMMGEVVKGQLQASIKAVTSPPLAASTIRRKGFAKPLIDTGTIWNSVDYEVSP